jgi:hypothetical protein
MQTEEGKTSLLLWKYLGSFYTEFKKWWLM